MPKGGGSIGEHVLFGKYRLCRKLGRGRSGTVYLAYHTQLEEYRAVKVVPKSMADYEVFRREALFLKTLRHPGIPIVYDVEEDAENSYLVEEYLEGESLYALVKRLGSLSVDTAAELGIQICRVIQFMNSAENPILYLDLQPNNLLVCGNQIRLIDFDHAQYAADVGRAGERYGTPGFAAPEQVCGEPLDCRTDVYAIGALLYFMCTGEAPGDHAQNRDMELEAYGGIGRVIRGCLAEKKEERYQTAGELGEALLERKDRQKEQAMQSQIFLFAGARPGIGTTHAALGMSEFLAQNGHHVSYQEEYDSDAVRMLARNMGLRADSAGVYHMGELSLRPHYGSSVCMPYPYYPIIIKDAGAFWKLGKEPAAAGLYAVVCGGKWWETDSSLLAARYFMARGRTVLLFNHVSGDFSLKLPADIRELPCLRLPFFPNPFRKDRRADACFRALFASAGGGETWEEKRKRRLFAGRKAVSREPRASEAASAVRILP